MPTATGYISQKTITTTTTTTKTVPKPVQRQHVEYRTSAYDRLQQQQQQQDGHRTPVPEPRIHKTTAGAAGTRQVDTVLSGVRADQNKNVILDTLAALVTDCNATAEVLRSRSSSKTNVNDDGRDNRLIYNLVDEGAPPGKPGMIRATIYERTIRRSRSTSPGRKAPPKVPPKVEAAPAPAPRPEPTRYVPVPAPAPEPVPEYMLKLHSPIYRTDGPDLDRPKRPLDDKSPSLERVCRDFDIETPARPRSVSSRPRSETPVSRKLIVLEDPKEYDAPICVACHHPIYGPCITALAPNSKMAQKYHPPHFVCNYCLKPLNLNGTYREHELKPYCHECFYRLFSGHIYVTDKKISLDIE